MQFKELKLPTSEIEVAYSEHLNAYALRPKAKELKQYIYYYGTKQECQDFLELLKWYEGE